MSFMELNKEIWQSENCNLNESSETILGVFFTPFIDGLEGD